MRRLILALAIAAAAGGAVAQQDISDGGGLIKMTKPETPAPGGARKQAEAGVSASFGNPAAIKFRHEGVRVASSVKHYAFDDPIAGPVSIVCGQYSLPDPSGAYGAYFWFFAAIKHGEVLWSDLDKAADGPGAAFNGCKGAGLTD